MIKKSRSKLFMLSVLLSVLLMGSSTGAFAKNQPSKIISNDILKETTSPKNKIEENNGIITINGEKVHYVPDSKIKINSDLANTDVRFVKPEELSDEEIVCEIFPKGSPHPTDVWQGSLGVCVFLATLSSLAENNPDFIKQNLIEYSNDLVIVKFFNYNSGFPIYIMVQKTIPNLLKSEGAFLSNNCLWVHMYLKAYVAMESILRKMDSIDYKCAFSGRLYPMFWIPGILTGKEIDMNLPWYTEEEQLYKEIKEALEIKGIVICTFDDSILCQVPVFKYFFKEIKYKGLFTHHAYSISQVYEDEKGIKWVCCRNPWGRFVPIYDKFGKLSIGNDDIDTQGYFWLKLKDFHKYCDRIYFSTEKNIVADVK